MDFVTVNHKSNKIFFAMAGEPAFEFQLFFHASTHIFGVSQQGATMSTHAGAAPHSSMPRSQTFHKGIDENLKSIDGHGSLPFPNYSSCLLCSGKLADEPGVADFLAFCLRLRDRLTLF